LKIISFLCIFSIVFLSALVLRKYMHVALAQVHARQWGTGEGGAEERMRWRRRLCGTGRGGGGNKRWKWRLLLGW
jgi:hypothetical protein